MHPDLAAQAADLYRAEREREACEERLAREARAARRDCPHALLGRLRGWLRPSPEERTARSSYGNPGMSEEAPRRDPNTVKTTPTSRSP